jgi:DNA polymerase III delta subunit
MAQDSFRPFVVAFGGEDYFLDRDIEKARLGKRSVLKLDAEDGLTDVQLVEHCGSYSELPRTIIVDNAQKVKGDKALSAFIEARDITDTSLILVAIVRSEKLSGVWSQAVSKGKVFERKTPKPWDTDSYLNFIKSEATRLRVAIGADVAAILLEQTGPDYYRLANELRKLALFVGQAATIKKEHIALITTRTPKAEPFQVAEATLAKDSRQALRLLSTLYANSGEDALIPVVRSLMTQVEKIARIRSLQDRGVSEGDIAVLLGMNEWRYKNTQAPVARKHELKSLVSHMGRLCRLDADVKGSSRSKRTLVELTVMSIAQ